jgi:hypothetical protein
MVATFLLVSPRRSPGHSFWEPAKCPNGRKIDLNELPRKSADLDLLDKAGDEGWELVVITVNSIAYLKRLIVKSWTKRKT